MSCLGVHFSIDEPTVKTIKSIKRESPRLDFIREVLEEKYFNEYPHWLIETDKAWDAIHRTLTDGDLTWENGQYPFNHLILGGERLYTKPDYLMILKTPPQVQDVAKAISKISKQQFRKSYFKIDPEKYGALVDEQDFEYSWSYFENLRIFWETASSEGRYILFTADQ
ncbi:MAG: YfbM family protein [Acidobacteriota bacterium]